ncbi:hypothetical protein FKM82_020218 [Ascaphus truei]
MYLFEGALQMLTLRLAEGARNKGPSMARQWQRPYYHMSLEKRTAMQVQEHGYFPLRAAHVRFHTERAGIRQPNARQCGCLLMTLLSAGKLACNVVSAQQQILYFALKGPSVCKCIIFWGNFRWHRF